MAAIPVNDFGKAIMVKNPNGGFYVKRRSFAKGAVPAHLKSYSERFTTAAHSCKGAGSSLSGMERVNAVRGCIKAALGGR